MSLDQTSRAYQIAVRKIARLKDVPGQLKNSMAFDILCTYFLSKLPLEWVIAHYHMKGISETAIRKLLATHEGEESSRRKDVRRIFKEMCDAFGIETGIHSEPGGGAEGTGAKRKSGKGSRGGAKPRKPPTARPFLPSLDRAVSREASEGN